MPRVLQRFTGGVFSFKEDAIFYIAATTNIDALVAFVNEKKSDLTYMHFADMLLAIGRANDGVNRDRAILGLKCLLLVRNMVSKSSDIVERNLRILQGSDFDGSLVQEIRKKAVSSDNLIELRNLVDELVAESTRSSVKA